MYMVVRQYEDASHLADLLTEQADDVKETLGRVEGFVAYYAAHDGDKLTTVSVCNDRAGAEETTQRAEGLVQKYLPGWTIGPPRLRAGEVLLSFTGNSSSS
jgi:NMD protein affecting ribosome stability and mRNA decay